MSIAFIALAILAATPATLEERLDEIQPGDTIVLRGGFTRITLPKRRFSPPITIDATAASVAGVNLHDVSGVTWRGGEITATFGPAALGPPSYGFAVRNAEDIRIEDARITRANRGVVVIDSSDVVMSALTIFQVSIDGVNVAGSDRVTLEGSTIGPFKPPFMTDNGPIHADGLQSWNGTTGLRIIDNIFRGKMAGIVDFGRPGETPDNIGTIIEGNRLEIAHTHGISITMTKGAIVRDNVINSGKSATRFRGTILRVLPDTLACGNIVEDNPDGPGTAGCDDRAKGGKPF